jgi:hypothetical protein
VESAHALNLTLSANIDPDRLAALARDLAHDLSDTGAKAHLIERPPKPGEKFDFAALGEILLTFLTHETALLAAECIKIYLFREPKLSVILKDPTGQNLGTLDAANADTAREVLKAHVR